MMVSTARFLHDITVAKMPMIKFVIESTPLRLLGTVTRIFVHTVLNLIIKVVLMMGKGPRG